jgi:hypothetical protein
VRITPSTSTVRIRATTVPRWLRWPLLGEIPFAAASALAGLAGRYASALAVVAFVLVAGCLVAVSTTTAAHAVVEQIHRPDSKRGSFLASLVRRQWQLQGALLRWAWTGRINPAQAP